MRRAVPFAACLLAVVVLAAASCGESDEEQAQDAICDARAEIQASVDNLSSLTVETATADQVRADVDTIQSGIDTIEENSDAVDEARRDEITSAVESFSADISAIASGLTSDLTIPEAQAEFDSAKAELRTAFDDGLARIDCS